MRHCDPEDLALRALGEPAGPAADDAHLAGCARCQLELDELRTVVLAGRSVTADDGLVPPPQRTWDRIADELGLAQHAGQNSGQNTNEDTGRGASHGSGHDAGDRPDPPHHLASVPASVPASGQGAVEALRPRRGRWGRTAALVAAAATAGVLAGVGVASLLADSPGDEPGAPPGSAPSVLAQAPLERVGDLGVEGRAVVTRDAEGRNIAVELTGLPAPAPGSYYEVWLIDRDVTKLVSLGPLDAGRGTLPVPDGLDLAAYPVVDVSIEPFDGDPGHSSVSVVRGTLPV